MAFPGRTLPAAAVVVFGLAFFGVLISIYPIAAFDTHSAAKLHLPILESDDDAPTVDPSEDDDTPTPTLMPTSDESLPSEDTEMYPGADEAKEAAFARNFEKEQKKPDEVARRNGLFGGALSNPAGRPADYPVIPKAEPPSSGPLPSENPTAAPQDPVPIPEDLHYDETLEPPPLETTLPDSQTDTELSYPQPPPDLPTDAETFPQPPLDLPADAEPPPPPPPNTFDFPPPS